MKRLLHRTLIVLLLLPLFSGCRKPDNAGDKIFHRSETMMGTVFSVQVWTGGELAGSREDVEHAVEQALAKARDIEHVMSQYREGSTVFRINELAGDKYVKADEMTWHVIEKSHELGLDTGGAFDITFAPFGDLWDWREESPDIPSKQAIEDARKLVGLENLEIDRVNRAVRLKEKGMKIGLGGVAKGYALDEMGAILEALGVTNYIVSGGGDLLIGGKKGKESWKVGVQHPRKKGGLIAQFEAGGRWAVATSGDYERFFVKDGRRFHHILDPMTGMPSTACVSATVITPSALRSDALATALMVLGPEKAQALFDKLRDFKALLIDSDMRFHRISDFPALLP